MYYTYFSVMPRRCSPKAASPPGEAHLWAAASLLLAHRPPVCSFVAPRIHLKSEPSKVKLFATHYTNTSVFSRSDTALPKIPVIIANLTASGVLSYIKCEAFAASEPQVIIDGQFPPPHGPVIVKNLFSRQSSDHASCCCFRVRTHIRRGPRARLGP